MGKPFSRWQRNPLFPEPRVSAKVGHHVQGAPDQSPISTRGLTGGEDEYKPAAIDADRQVPTS